MTKRVIGVLIVVALAVAAIGQVPNIGIPALFDSFGGMSDAAPTDMLGGLPLDIQNFNFRFNGIDQVSLVKRDGYEAIGQLVDRGSVGGIYVYSTAGQPTQLLASIGKKFYTYNSSVNRWTDISGDTREGIAYCQNGNDTVAGLGTTWWGFSTEAYDSIKLNATKYDIRAILLDSLILLETGGTGYAGTTDSAVACTLYGAGSASRGIPFRTVDTDRPGYRAGDTLYVFSDSVVLRYAGGYAQQLSLSPSQFYTLSDWDAATMSATLSGGRGLYTGSGWVQIQSQNSGDYNVAIYTTGANSNSQHLRLDTTLYAWLNESKVWSARGISMPPKIATPANRWDTLVAATITTALVDSQLVDSVKVDSSIQRMVLINGAPTDHPTDTYCTSRWERYSYEWSYRYIFRHRIFVADSGGVDPFATWVRDSVSFGTRLACPALTENGGDVGEYSYEPNATEVYSPFNVIVGELLDTLGWAIPDTGGATIEFEDFVCGGLFTPSAGNLTAESIAVWLTVIGTSATPYEMGAAIYDYDVTSGVLTFLDSTNTKDIVPGDSVSGWYYFDLLGDVALNSDSQYVVMAWSEDTPAATTLATKWPGVTGDTSIHSKAMFKSLTYAQWPATITPSTVQVNSRISIYAICKKKYLEVATYGVNGDLATVVHTSAGWKQRRNPLLEEHTTAWDWSQETHILNYNWYTFTPNLPDVYGTWASNIIYDSIYGDFSTTGGDTYFLIDSSKHFESGVGLVKTTGMFWYCLATPLTGESALLDTTYLSGALGARNPTYGYKQQPCKACLSEENPPGPDSLLYLPPGAHPNRWYDKGSVLASGVTTGDSASEIFSGGDSIYIMQLVPDTITAFSDAFDTLPGWTFPIVRMMFNRFWCTGDPAKPEMIKVTVDWPHLFASDSAGGTPYGSPSPLEWEDPVTFEIDSFFVRDPFGLPVTALGVHQGTLFPHKPTGIWSCPIDRSTLDPTGVYPTTSSVGALAQRGLVETQRGHYFVSYNGVYRFDGTNSEIISGPLASFWRDSVEQSALARATVVYDPDRDLLKVSVPGAGCSDNTVTLVLDLEANLWTKYTYGMGVSAQVPYPTERLRTYFGDPDRAFGKVYREAQVPTDDGAAFTALWRSGWLPLVEVGKEASIQEWYTEAKYDSSSGLLVFSTFADEGGTPVVVDTIVSEKAGWRTTREAINYIVKGERLSFQIELVSDWGGLSQFRVDFRDEGTIKWSD